MSKADLNSILNKFLKKYQIESFSIAGFSLGAKFALSSYELFPEKVDELILIAPEGITINTWYKIATGTRFTRGIFKFIAKHPSLLFLLAKLVNLTGLINPKLATFAMKQMETEDNRLRVYHSWVVFRRLSTNNIYLANLIRKYETRVQIYLGRLDKIITKQTTNPLIKKVPEYIEVKVIDSDHSRLLEAFAKKFNNY